MVPLTVCVLGEQRSCIGPHYYSAVVCTRESPLSAAGLFLTCRFPRRSWSLRLCTPQEAARA